MQQQLTRLDIYEMSKASGNELEAMQCNETMTKGRSNIEKPSEQTMTKKKAARHWH
jgi:hypothetical protein